MNFDRLFNPRTVAVVGAAPEPTRVGYALMKNLTGGSGRTIIPVTEKYPDVLGVPTVKTLADVQGEVDLVVIAVKASLVPSVLSVAAEKGIPHTVIISAGFKEEGEEGKKLEDEIAALARVKGMTLIGPNCLGVIDTHADMNASFVVTKPIPGHVGFISQSGAIGTALLDWARTEGVGFSKFVSLGNEAGTTEVDMMEHFADDDATRAVLMYLEKVSDGARFMDAARRITAKKPLVILRAGRSARGSAAVMSHTGSLAPDDAIFEAACRESGAITVETLRDLFSLAKILHMDIRNPVQRLAVVTNGGGPSVNATDLIDLSRSLQLGEFSDTTRSALRAVLPPMAAVGNPVDVIGDATSTRYADTLSVVAELSDIDAILVIVTPQMMTDPAAIARTISFVRAKKPVIPVFMGGAAAVPGIAVLKESGLVNFDIPTDAILALDELACRRPKVSQEVHHAALAPHPSNEEMLDMETTQKLLSQYGIPLLGVLMKNGSVIEATLTTLGGNRFAMKAISKDVVHKSDAGAVRINLTNKEDVARAWEEMYKSITAKHPGAVLEGMLIQHMKEGTEVIIGMKRDATFGPVILFGMGGIFAEAMKDTALAIAPVTEEEAQKMIRSIKGARLLQGMRGKEPVSERALVDVIVNLSRLAVEHPEIVAIDLNPVMASSTQAAIVDARFMVMKGE